jgi:hypothetical protein
MPVARSLASEASYASPESTELAVVREREYPREGADSYDAVPDSAILYSHKSAPSALARDPLYVTGDPDGALPEVASPASPKGEQEPEPRQGAPS